MLRLEQRSSDAHHRRALLDGDLEVGAHAHRQLLQPPFVAKLAQPPKMWARCRARASLEDAEERRAPGDAAHDARVRHDILTSFSLSSHRRLRAAGSDPWPGVAISLRLANILPVTFAVSGAVASQSAVSAPF